MRRQEQATKEDEMHSENSSQKSENLLKAAAPDAIKVKNQTKSSSQESKPQEPGVMDKVMGFFNNLFN